MRKHEISQLPVIVDQKSIGFISEKILLKSVLSGQEENIADIMGESPPVVSKNTPANAISNLLNHFSMVIVSDGGDLVGVITRSDLLNAVYEK